MIFNDGDYVICVIQHKYKKIGEWAQSGEADSFITNIPKDSRRSKTFVNAIDEFRASGKCWQKIGIHATFNLDVACDVVKLIAQHNPEHTFRVARINLAQFTEQVALFDFTKSARETVE